MSDPKREQLIKQCDAVRHMAEAIARIHGDYGKMFRSGAADQLIDQVGKRTARLMETLGDVLNGIDAVTEEDDWLKPVFKNTQRLRWLTETPLRSHES